MRRLFPLLFILFTPPVLLAQSPAAEWMTVETAHFRIHFPEEYREWAMRAAERIESTRDLVTREVGFAARQKVDVIVTNPIAEPNGSAWPLVDTPRIVFFAEPPGPDEQIGAYGHWIDLLSVHEVTHVMHMLRPSRNPFAHAIETSLVPFTPITLRAPRWVLEGYATVVEGRLTGAGRPSSTVRALILRRWAQAGRLPSYAQLNSDRRFLGMSMAYLMGSAFLEWLEERQGPGSLRNLWSRLTARERRSFDAAFDGVFGESPERLYGQFLAELTASAIAVDRSSPLQEGELFQEPFRASGDPAVAPDGGQLALVIRPREGPERLVIWSTGPPEKEEKEFAERLGRILARDPEDVAPVRTRPLARKELHSLTMPDGGDLESPRWLPGGDSLLFAHRMPDAEGFLHFDLFRWTPGSGELRRITQLADVRDADPRPDGKRAIAVRNRFGASQLVEVDLETGGVSPLTDASIDIVETDPRISPDGRRIARVAHRAGRWSLLIDDVPVALPGDPSSPEWLSNDELIVTLGARGFAELHRIRLDGTFEPITRSAGGAFQSAPSPAGGPLFFMSLTPDGYVLRSLASLEATAAWPPLERVLVPAIPPAASASLFSAFEPSTLPVPHRYGAGRQEPFWFAGMNVAPQHRAFEGGVRFGDVVGRLDTIVVGSIGWNDAPEGGALISAWRGWPVELHAHAWATRDESGGELRALWTRRGPRHRVTLEGGASDDVAFGSAAFSTRQVAGRWQFDETVRLDRIDEESRAAIGAALRNGSFRLAARYQKAGGTELAVGGLASSILPRSAWSAQILDPSLPAFALAGRDYDGWRLETTIPALPLSLFYQRHSIGEERLSIAGVQLERSIEENPLLKLPGLDFTAGVARILDEPFEGETRWWMGMRWRP